MADREDNPMGYLDLDGGGNPDDTTRMIINWVQSKETQKERAAEAGAEAAAKPEPESDAENEAVPEAEAEAEPKSEAEGEADSEPEAESGAGIEEAPEAELETEPETEPEPGSEAEADPETEPGTGFESEAEPEAGSDPDAGSDADAEPEPDVETGSEEPADAEESDEAAEDGSAPLDMDALVEEIEHELAEERASEGSEDDGGSDAEETDPDTEPTTVEDASDTAPTSATGGFFSQIREKLASVPYDGKIGFIVKHAASFLFLLFVTIQRGPAFFVVGAFELIAIAAFSNWLSKINKVAATIVDGVLFVLFNVQLGVLFFGNDWFSYQMYSNLKYTEDVGGGMGMFIPALIAVLVLAFLPIEHLDLPISDTGLTSIALFGELVCALTMGNTYSPIYAYFDLARQVQEAESRMTASVNITPDAAQFFHEGIEGGIEKPANMPEHPNVILIFTEGLSQNIVEDERGLMPNVRDYQQRSLSFVNYYNHTAATENGLYGQMFSGWFYPNHLVSIQSIMHDTGYHTAFINTEPNNAEFTALLDSLGYDEFVSEPGEYEGAANSLSDRQAYDLLFEKALELEAQEQPFFLAIYTFGTHAFIDSPDEVFGDGTNPELNKFYNADVWFGRFMERFESSELFNDTIIVFTADHCAYGDQPYLEAFPDHPRVYNFTDTMPFFIYHQGITPRTYDVSSRTTLCMAPTVLDYLDISAPNYFLGTSLLAYRESDSWIEHFYSDWANTTSTFTNNVAMMSGEERQRFWDFMAEYTAAREAEPAEESADDAPPDAGLTLPDAEAEESLDEG